MDNVELLKAMREMMADQNAKQEHRQAKADARQEQMVAEIKAGKADQEQIKKEIMAGQARMQAKMDAWLTKMKDWRRESMACQESTEANPETMEACRSSKELNPEVMESEVEFRKVPTEEAAVESFKDNEEAAQGLAYGCMATWEANGTDPKRLWIPGVVGCRLQEGVTPCNSGMAQEVRFQEDSDPGQL
jgi:hypothetical protein